MNLLSKDRKRMADGLQKNVKRINHRICPSAIILPSVCNPFSISLLSYCDPILLPPDLGFHLSLSFCIHVKRKQGILFICTYIAYEGQQKTCQCGNIEVARPSDVWRELNIVRMWGKRLRSIQILAHLEKYSFSYYYSACSKLPLLELLASLLELQENCFSQYFRHFILDSDSFKSIYVFPKARSLKVQSMKNPQGCWDVPYVRNTYINQWIW